MSQPFGLTVWPSNQAHLCAKGHGLRNICAGSDPRVKEDIQLATHGLDDSRKHAERAHPAVHLPSAMIADHYSLDPKFNAFLSVPDSLNTLDNNWT